MADLRRIQRKKMLARHKAAAKKQGNKKQKAKPKTKPKPTAAAKTNAFVKQQGKAAQAFAKTQTKVINKALQQQVSQLQKMLGSMQQKADKSLSGFTSALSASTAASSNMLREQQKAFSAQNRVSEANIKKAQSQIVGLPPAPSKTKQISSDFERVSAGDRFSRIGVSQAPIQVDTSPALTGFSTRQRESQARQIQGLSGFRSSRA
jgi:hypothetical protein